MYSVQYAAHFYGYLKEWRKNPHWSFSCCLALILPLIDLPGELGGLTETNILNTQLDTGHMERTTVVGSMIDGAGTNAAVKGNKQDHENPVEVHGDNCTDPQLQNDEKETPILAIANKQNEAICYTLGDGPDDDNSTKLLGDNCNDDKYVSKKYHRGTQTELCIVFSSFDYAIQGSAGKTNF